MHAYNTGLEVIKKRDLTNSSSSSVNSKVLTGILSSKCFLIFSIIAYSTFAVLSPERTSFIDFSILLSSTSKSEKINSKLIVSISLIGDTDPST